MAAAALEVRVQEEQDYMSEIGGHIIDHQVPFTVLGQGRTALRYKYQRMCWSIRLEVGSNRALQQVLSSLLKIVAFVF